MQLTPAFKRLRGFSRETSGIAVVEFAIVLPFLIALILYGLETANLVLAHLRISRIASMTADNASRVRDSIDEADINELMDGANLVGGSFKLKERGKIVLSSLQRNAKGTGQWILWQRCYGDLVGGSSYGATDKGKDDSSLPAMGPAGKQIAAADGTSVMFVEVRYAYQPLIGSPWGSARTISYVSSYNVRKRPNEVPTNAGKLPANKRALCPS